jgi:hypothetical protein
MKKNQVSMLLMLFAEKSVSCLLFQIVTEIRIAIEFTVLCGFKIYQFPYLRTHTVDPGSPEVQPPPPHTLTHISFITWEAEPGALWTQ